MPDPYQYQAAPHLAGQPVEDVQDAGAPVASAYSSPHAYGSYDAPAAPRTATLGWVALAAGAMSLIGSVINALIVAAVLSPETLDASSDGGGFAVGAAFVLANGLLLWFGFGLWALVQGIVAIVMKRGVVQGAVAVLLGLVGPLVGVIIAVSMVVSAFANI